MYLGVPVCEQQEKPSGRVTALQGVLRVGNHRGRRKKDFRPLQRSSEQNLHCWSQLAVAKKEMALGVGRTLGRGSPPWPHPGCLERIRSPPPSRFSCPPVPFEQGAGGWDRGPESPARARAAPGWAQPGGDALQAPRGLRAASLAELSKAKPSRAGQYGAGPGQEERGR